MTVTYTAEVATVTGLGSFPKLLKRWRGSIYKLIWMDVILFLSMYYMLNLTYRFLLSDPGKELFENIVRYCRDYSQLIPLSFVLGFYVSIVMTRWWGQYTTIPRPDSLAVFVSTTIHGQDERGRVMRRTVMRYVCLCLTMTFTMISPRVKKRFPNLDHFVQAGLLQPNEKDIMDDMNKKFPPHAKYWMPIIWAASIITRARKEGRIRDDFAVKTLIDELSKIRGGCGQLLNYDRISIPLVYTQVVTLAVYTYFLTTLMGHQWVEGNIYKFDLYFPIFTVLQFFFYMGWLKVAESLINPFGDDDDDFEMNWLVDRNLQVSYLIVDEMHHEHPELVRDQYWDEVFPQKLPYPATSIRESHPLPSTANIAVRPDEIHTPSSIKIDDFQSTNDMNSSPFTFSARPYRSPSIKSRVGGDADDTHILDGGMSRVNSVSSVLKRWFSREDSKTEAKAGSSQELSQLTTHHVKPRTSIRKIGPSVIEEVDEQMTITSQTDAKEPRASVIGYFPTPSQPINVPNSLPNWPSNSYQHEMSKSVPGNGDQGIDGVSIGGSETDHSNSDEEFFKLRQKRSEERFDRLKINLARSISTIGSDSNEADLLLFGRTNSSNAGSP